MRSFDELRALFPGCGLAAYAYEPGGPVTLEIIEGDDTHRLTRSTLTACVAALIPDPPPEAVWSFLD